MGRLRKTKPKTPWVDTVRRASGLTEHICSCGVGHAAVGSVHWFALHGVGQMGVHGECAKRCCRDPKWVLADALEGMRVANTLLARALHRHAETVRAFSALRDVLAQEPSGRGGFVLAARRINKAVAVVEQAFSLPLRPHEKRKGKNERAGGRHRTGG